MNNKQKMTGGVIVPIISPIDQNENIDEPALRAVIQHCIQAGVDGIFAGGSAGMGPLLSDAAWRDLMAITADEACGRVKILSGIITTSTARAVERIKIVEKLGFDAIVVTPTFYIAIHSYQEMLAHFNNCRQATDMEMVAYNIPGCTGSVVPAEVIETLAKEKSISLVKESSGNSQYFMSLLNICHKYDTGLMQGNEIDFDWSLSSGAAGIVPVCANYNPALFVKLYQTDRKDQQNMTRLQQEISALRLALGADQKNWISGIMYGMRTLGFGSGIPVMPLQEISDAKKAEIDQLTVGRNCMATV